MERYFCRDKKDYCDKELACRGCEFAKGSGVINGVYVEDVLSTLFGDDYNLDRLKELVKADREGRYIIMRDAERNGVARLKELSEADREGRIAILSEPMKPMVYKPNDTDVYCPNCGETLSGGWPLSDADDCRKIYQCFYCGQSIDTEKCVPYESDLKESENDDRA